MPTYQPIIPTGTVPLDVDYQNLQDNFSQLNTVYGIDHSAFVAGTAIGYHQVVHLFNNSVPTGGNPKNQPITPPAAVANTGELFTAQINDDVSLDTALYYQSAAGNLSQLTRNFAPVVGTSGKTFLPGGLIMIWDTVTVPGPGQVNLATFPSSGFPTACFGITATMRAIAGDPGSPPSTIMILSNTATTFVYRVLSNLKFFYIALGN